MFTGIVEITGVVQSFKNGKLVLSHPWTKEELRLGQSIAVNGCCLTVVEFDEATLSFDLTYETIQRTSFAKLKNGFEVNLERPLKFGATLDGHMVTGHVDSTGVIRSIENLGLESRRMWIDPSISKLQWVVEKGSVTIDGVSLTINETDDKGFSVALIPHTLQITTLKNLHPGDFVNLEFDLLAKYVERILDQRKLHEAQL